MKVFTLYFFTLAFLVACSNPQATSAPISALPQGNPSTPAATLADEPQQAEITIVPTQLPQQAPGNKGQKNKEARTQAFPTASNALFLAPEMAGLPTDSTVSINLLPATAATIIIEYGTNGVTLETSPIQSTANTPLQINLTELSPDSEYFYYVIANDTRGVRHTFHTARSETSKFVFEIQGDSHPERIGRQFDANLYDQVLANAAKDEPDFYITMGDDFSVDSLKEVNQATVNQIYLNQRRWLSKVDAPVFLVNGNHEQASLANLDGSSQSVAVLAQTARNTMFPVPYPSDFYSGNEQPVENIGLLGDYYSWEWGNALFVVIDPYWHSTVTVDNQFGVERNKPGDRDLWSISLGDEQYQWFQKILHESNAQYKFVFTHHVLGTGRGGIELATGYEWGDAEHLAAHRPGWERTIHQVMVEEGVTIFFQGHDHIFAKQILDGVIYQTLPEPANPTASWENKEAYKSGVLMPNSGRVQVEVSPTGLIVSYIQSVIGKEDEVTFFYEVQ